MTGFLQRLVARAHGIPSPLMSSSAVSYAGNPFAAASTLHDPFASSEMTAEDSPLQPGKAAQGRNAQSLSEPPRSVAEDPPFAGVVPLATRRQADAIAPQHSRGLRQSIGEGQQPTTLDHLAEGTRPRGPTSPLMAAVPAHSDPLPPRGASFTKPPSPVAPPSSLDELLSELVPLLPRQGSVSLPQPPALSIPSAGPPDSLGSKGSSEREVHVSIGRIEVKAQAVSTSAPTPKAERLPSLSLEAYLAERQGGRR